jgi:hypothetical protein
MRSRSSERAGAHVGAPSDQEVSGAKRGSGVVVRRTLWKPPVAKRPGRHSVPTTGPAKKRVSMEGYVHAAGRVGRGRLRRKKDRETGAETGRLYTNTKQICFKVAYPQEGSDFRNLITAHQGTCRWGPASYSTMRLGERGTASFFGKRPKIRGGTKLPAVGPKGSAAGPSCTPHHPPRRQYNTGLLRPKSDGHARTRAGNGRAVASAAGLPEAISH